MQAFIRIKFQNGATFEIPTKVVVDHRANKMFAEQPSEFPGGLPDAIADTEDFFDDMDFAIEWLTDHMTWKDVEPIARLIKFEPLPMDIDDLDTDLEPSDYPGITGEVDGNTALKTPIGLLLAQMAEAKQRSCAVVMQQDNSDGTVTPYAMSVLIMGNAQTLDVYQRALASAGQYLDGVAGTATPTQSPPTQG